ncbi:MAG: TraR/DksA family transcriptional regulator [Gemmatimonadota bacterium]|nr:TraR/DksA family transcriptional regulator [Gemmatimonadota bacterium]
MNKKQKKVIEKRLIEEREKILKEMGHFGETFMQNLKDSAGDLSSYSFHMADMGSDVENQEKAFQYASKEGRLLYHIDEALRRLYKDQDFGICQSCKCDIGIERLTAVPHARLCINCKSKEENAR